MGGSETSLSKTASGLPMARVQQGIHLYKQLKAMDDRNLAWSLGQQYNKPRYDNNDRVAMENEWLARKLAPGMKIDKKLLYQDVENAVRATGAQSLTGRGELADLRNVKTPNIARMSPDNSGIRAAY